MDEDAELLELVEEGDDDASPKDTAATEQGQIANDIDDDSLMDLMREEDASVSQQDNLDEEELLNLAFS